MKRLFAGLVGLFLIVSGAVIAQTDAGISGSNFSTSVAYTFSAMPTFGAGASGTQFNATGANGYQIGGNNAVTGTGHNLAVGLNDGTNVANLNIVATDVLRLQANNFTAGADVDIWAEPANCGGFSVLSERWGSIITMASPHFCDTATFTGTIVGTALTFPSATGSVGQGQLLTYAGCNKCAYITGGSGTSWTLNTSPGDVSSVSMSAAATASAHLTVRPPNSNETRFQFASSNNVEPVMETGLAVATNTNPFKLISNNSGAVLSQSFTGLVAGSITWPSGTVDFSATGGTHKFIAQTIAGGAFTVVQPATTDLSDIGTFSLSTTGSGTFGSNGQAIIQSPSGAPTLTSDVSHGLTVKSGAGNSLALGDSVINIGSSQTNSFTATTGSGDPIFSVNAGNMNISTGSGSKIVLKNNSGAGAEIFGGSANDIRLINATNPQIGSSGGAILIQSASGVVQISSTLKYGTFTASGTCTILGTFSMQDSSGVAHTVPYCS